MLRVPELESGGTPSAAGACRLGPGPRDVQCLLPRAWRWVSRRFRCVQREERVD